MSPVLTHTAYLIDMQATLKVIDSISDWLGKVARWLCVLLVLVVVYEVTARHLFNAPTIWAYETSSMIAIAIVSVGWSYTHRHGGHIRIDVIYNLLPRRGQALLDVICTVLLFLPVIIILTWTAATRVLFSLSLNEKLIAGYWYPPAAPIRIVLFIGLMLFLMQGLAQLIRDLHLLIGRKSS